MARFRRLSDRADDPRWQYFTPAAPTSVTATATNAQAVVSWTAPAIVVPPLTDYSVQYSTDGGSTWTTFTDAVSTATTATITGLTNGTAHVFRVAGINGIGTGAYSTASAAVTPTAGDPLFGSVSLLLPFDGTGNTFVDSSPIPKTITAVGNATQSTAESKFGGKSALFDGTGDYLTIPANNAFDLPGDWTIEFWVRFSAPPGNYSGAFGAAIAACYRGIGGSGGQGWQVRINGNSTSYTTINLYTGNADLNWSYGGFALNQWHYVALARASNTIRAYVDGVQAGDAISNSNSMSSTNQFSVGRLANESQYLFDLNGYLDDLRITKGSARGMTGSTITVPTAAFLEAVPGTDPLFSSVSLLLPFDGTGSTFVDSSATPKAITAVGNATQSATQSKFGGKSLALDGASATRIASNAAFGFGTGDFTVEFFLYYTGGNGYVFFFMTNESTGPYIGYGLQNGTRRPWVWNNGDVLNTSTNITNNVWQHHAVVRSGGVLTIYLDGVATGSTTFTADLGSSRPFGIGDNGIGGQLTNGFIDELRVTKGVARYTANFTPPTEAFKNF
jgi:hypothetical protein